MNRVFRVLVLPLLMSALLGCANLVSPINPYITQSQCVTHEECLKAANLPHLTNPDHTFVIEEKEFDDMVKAPRMLFLIKTGWAPVSNKKYDIYMDICVGKALAALYPLSHILIGVPQKDTDVYISSFRDLDSRSWNGITTTFNGSVTVSGTTNDIAGIAADVPGESGLLGHGDGGNTVARACQSACMDFAQKVKTILDQKELPK